MGYRIGIDIIGIYQQFDIILQQNINQYTMLAPNTPYTIGYRTVAFWLLVSTNEVPGFMGISVNGILMVMHHRNI
jgi:hypothetical protein